MKYSEYVQYDGLGLAQLVQRKHVTAQELFTIAWQRTQDVNPKINAIVITMYEQAQHNLKNNPTGLFSGIPFLLKDLHQEYQGVLTSFGSNSLKRLNYISPQHSEMVKRWTAAGVIPFGLTNSPEFGIKGITEPKAWGSCHNPWHLKHNSGGSSGGSAAAVAAGIVPIAGASDGGGSIRIPASYCGLFGLKPSRGRTPWGPNISEAMHGAVSQHVLTKTVRDSAAMLDLTQGSDHNALFNIEKPQGKYLELIQTSPKPLKIAFSTQSPIGTSVSQDAKDAISHTVQLLVSLGHHVEEAQPDLDGMQLAKDFITTWFSQCAYTVQQFKRDFGVQDADFELDTLAIAAFGAKATALDYIHNLNNWGNYVKKMNYFFDQYDLYLTPSTASVAPKNGEIKTPTWQIPILKGLLKVDQAHLLAKGKLVEHLVKNNLRWVPFTQLANITGLPAMSVPLYWNKHNLPLGSQFIAPFGREDRLLQLAAQLEQTQPWLTQFQNIVV